MQSFALKDLDDKATVLVVDDTASDLSLIANLLKGDYRVQVANHGDKCLEIARSDSPPDLILLDIMMPEPDGYEVCRALKADPALRDIPVIFLTGKTGIDDEQMGLELGAVDYITKPVSPPIVMARVATHLALKASADFLRDKNSWLEAEISKRRDMLEGSKAIRQACQELGHVAVPNTGWQSTALPISFASQMKCVPILPNAMASVPFFNSAAMTNVPPRSDAGT